MLAGIFSNLFGNQVIQMINAESKYALGFPGLQVDPIFKGDES